MHIKKSRVDSSSARLPARRLAAAEVVQEHVHLAAAGDRGRRVVAEPPRDGVGHDAEALPELVDKAEGQLAVPHGRPDEEQPGRLRALVLQREQRRALGAPALLPAVLRGAARILAGLLLLLAALVGAVLLAAFVVATVRLHAARGTRGAALPA